MGPADSLERRTRKTDTARRGRPALTIILACAIALALTLPLAAAPALSPLAGRTHAEDQIIVRFRPGQEHAAALLHFAARTELRRSIPALGVQTVRLRKGADLQKALERYRSSPAVEYAGPNHVLRIATQRWPNDPILLYGWDYLDLGFIILYQWGLYNDGSGSGFGSGGLPRADIKAPEAWAVETGSPNVVIAVVDTGIDYTHPDLSAKVWRNTREIPGNGIDDDGNGFVDDWRGWDFTNNDNDPWDDHSQDGMDVQHGTFVSAIAAAGTNDGVGMAGVSWGSPVMALKVMDSNGYGLEDDAAAAVVYAADNGAKIINMSLTGEDAPALRAAIQYAWSKGCLIVAASGNSGTSEDTYPASYPEVLSVGATNEYDQRCTAADWGQGGSNYGSYLDVMAPGNNILSATSAIEPQGYFVMPGTSAAAPFVTGVAALVWSRFPDWTNQQVFNQIVRTCDDLGTAGWDVFTGWGRVNAYRALTETPQDAQSIGAVKDMLSGTSVALRGVVLSTSSGEIPGRLYVQEQNRSCGILLYYQGTVPSGLQSGDVVELFGTVGQISGERAILGAQITKTGFAGEPRPLGMTNRNLGGAQMGRQQGVVDQYSFPRKMATGLNNIGLLVSTWGKVTAVGTDWFYLDDGAGLDDGGVNTGVFVHCPNVVRPGLNRYVRVTGISGCEIQQGSPVPRRVLRPRRQSDIEIIK
ncbi:MAG: S8 family peptidase [Armatimonadota bacterium]